MELKIVKNKCPYCNETLLVNKRTFANHVRWCKKNPRYEEILSGTKSKLSCKRVERREHSVLCEFCGKEYKVFCTDKEYTRGCYKKTCSDLCAKRLTAKKGGNERRKSISKGVRKYVSSHNENYDEEEMVFIKICEFCGKKFKTKKSNQKFCSVKCAMSQRHKNFTKEAEKFDIYKRQCAFLFSLNDYPLEFDFSLINENGWYKAKNRGDNLKGVTRDHMFSIKRGYEEKIDPYFISHPANCMLLVHPENASKHSGCSITKNELKRRVDDFNEKYGVYENKINYDKIEEFIYSAAE